MVLLISGSMVRDRRQWLMAVGRLRFTHLLAVLLAGALQFPMTASGVPAADYQGTLKIGGTGAAVGTITQVAAAFQKQHPDVRFVFPPSLGSTGGIKAVIAGALDVGLNSRPLTEAERSHGLVLTEYARTPLLLVTSHKGAGVNFTLKQIASLYSGEIHSYPDGTPLRVIMRPEVEIDIHLVRGLSPEIDAAVHRAQSREGMGVAVTDHDNAEMLVKTRGATGWMTMAQLISEDLELTPLPIDNILADPGKLCLRQISTLQIIFRGYRGPAQSFGQRLPRISVLSRGAGDPGKKRPLP